MTITVNIAIEEKVLFRLGSYAQKNELQSSSEAIAALLDAHNAAPPKSPPSFSSEVKTGLHSNSPRYYGDRLEIEYFPSGEENFKQKFLLYKRAYVRIHYLGDKNPIIRLWNAYRFSETSSVSGNLASGYLRGWREKGICKAEISIEPFANSQGGE